MAEEYWELAALEELLRRRPRALVGLILQQREMLAQQAHTMVALEERIGQLEEAFYTPATSTGDSPPSALRPPEMVSVAPEDDPPLVWRADRFYACPGANTPYQPEITFLAIARASVALV